MPTTVALSNEPIACREASAEDVPAMLDLRNQIFPTITAAEFLSVSDLTAIIATSGNEVVGALPLAIREFQIGPGETCQVAFLHAVGTHPARRGQGIGQRMVAAAKESLRGRVEALFVYRTGGERTDGYSFYHKAGFHELLFATTCRLQRRGDPAAASITHHVGAPEISGREQGLLEIFHSFYQGFGGHWARKAGFYARALHSSYYHSRPHEFSLFTVRTAGRLIAYAIVGRPLLPQDSHRRVILEIATLPGSEHEISHLLAAIDHAAPPEAEIRFPTSTSSPVWPQIIPHIQEEAVRSPVLLGCLLDPAGRAQRAWRGNQDSTNVTAWTPQGDFPLNRCAGANRTVTIGLKENMLLRLLLRRLDLPSAHQIEAATLHGAEAGDEASLARALPAFPWVYQGLDYL